MKQYRNIFCLLAAGAVALMPAAAVCAASQNETVYVKLQNDGTTKETSVVKHLINTSADDKIIDQTSLSAIENLNGFEEYEFNNGRIIWNAQGGDIYYSGESSSDLPVTVELTYKFNDEECNPSDVIGQSGHIDIIAKFTNHSKSEDLYTPFVVAMTTMFEESSVSNVTVTNGDTTSNGRTVSVAAVAAPGLYESLGLEELKDLDEVRLSFDTDKFELNDIYMIVTPKVLNNVDLKTFTQLDDLYAKSNKLTASSAQLVNGATQLRNGISEFKNALGAAKQKIQQSAKMLSEIDLSQFRNTAKVAAAQQVEIQSATIQAGINTQVEGNEILMNALRLQAAEMCQAQHQQTCTEQMIESYAAQLVSGVEQSLFQNSLELARTTAEQVAEATVTQTVNTFSELVNSKLLSTLSPSLDVAMQGIDDLLTGAVALQEGMQEFDSDGIKPLTSFVSGTVKVTSDKVERLTKLAAEYSNFSGVAPGVSADVKFIMMVEGKKED